MEGAMGLMRRMPPKHTQTALSALLSLLPDHSSDLLSQIDQPLQLVDYGIRNADVISVLLEICILFVFGLLNCDLGEVAIFSLLGNIWNYISRAARHNNASSNAAVSEVLLHTACNFLPWMHPMVDPVFILTVRNFTQSCNSTKQVLCDEDSGKEFILCEYNRDADSYKSPWSNKFHPHLEDGMYPSEELRKLEVEANEVFTIYRDQYYEGGISSVYLWEEDDNEGFVACFLIKKDGSKYAHGKRGYLHEGGWEAIHVIQVGPDEEGMAHYCLTSTIMLSLTTDSDTSGTFNLSGSIRRQITSLQWDLGTIYELNFRGFLNINRFHLMKADLSVEDGHLCNMGKMIEELEGKLRNQLDQVYFGKTKEMFKLFIVFQLHIAMLFQLTATIGVFAHHRHCTSAIESLPQVVALTWLLTGGATSCLPTASSSSYHLNRLQVFTQTLIQQQNDITVGKIIR
ncbi:probable F-actin-capping protein subunit beta [Tanacetum coccineum]|uniref:Probable F-actin-capping protein subunit beta n=1 Tax=Tanacetum coccineum TaxID=301880 RepID=A0ABQ5DQP5_9ASTR